MVAPFTPHLRIVRDPLASYIRPFSRDYRNLAQLLAEGRTVGSGIVFDGRDLQRSSDVRTQVRSQGGTELIFDPLSVELSTSVGLSRHGIADLPWAGPDPHEPSFFSSARVRQYCDSIAQFALGAGATAILAPTHFIESVPSQWFGIDPELATALREALNRRVGGENVSIYYPLVTTLHAVQSEKRRDYLLAQLQRAVDQRAVDALWLRIHGFGVSRSGPVNLRRYFEFARATHRLRVPVVAERTGTLGLALLAFGAVGGIEQGITFGDHYDVRPLYRPRKPGRAYMPAPRVYLSDVGLFLKKHEAGNLLSSRAIKHRFACQRACCPRGVDDMLAEPRRHFIVSRSDEVRLLSAVPEDRRPDEYLEMWLRPASDRATVVARIEPRLMKHRTRLDQWRASLSEQRELDRYEEPSHSTIPTWPRHAAFVARR